MRHFLSRLCLLVLALNGVAACSNSSSSSLPVATEPPPPPSLSSDATLSALSTSAAEFDQIFQPTLFSYTGTAKTLTDSMTVTAIVNDANASLAINGVDVVSGQASAPIPLEVGRNTATVAVTAEDGVTVQNYGIDMNRQDASSFAQRVYIKPDVAGASDQFARTLAFAGDTLVVAAVAEDSSASGINGNAMDDSETSAGAAYVFTRDASNTWSQQGYLKASNAEMLDEFAHSVAISGDMLAVGALREDSASTGINGDQADNSAQDAGAVYIFRRDVAGLWMQEAYIKASNAEAGDGFGVAVALSGDTLVVGAQREDSAASGVDGDQSDNTLESSGAAYVFQRDVNGIWTQQAYLKASNPGLSDQFGTSIVISGDTIAIGSPNERSAATGLNGDQADDSLSLAGAVYVFERDSSDAWTQSAYIKASNTDQSDQFGNALALSGDTLAVGAPYEDSAATGIGGDQSDNSLRNPGAVYIFTKDMSLGWSQQAYIKPSNTDVQDQFGMSVALDGVFLAVGSSDDSIATGVGGDQTDNSAVNAGAVYLFERNPNGTWVQNNYIKASNTEASDLFGHSIALDNAVLAVGALNEDSAATGVGGDEADNNVMNAGAAFIFE